MKKTFRNSIKTKYQSFSPKTKTFIKLCAATIIMACGPSPLDYAEYFSLFYPETGNTPPETKPYYYSALFLNEESYFYEENPSTKIETTEESENINAWSKYLKSKVSRDIIKSAFYGESKLGLLASKVSAFDKGASLYLIFAQEVENSTPHRVNYWDDAPIIDSLKIEGLVEKAKTGFENAGNDFLKERYLFQKIKLNAEIGKYDAVIDDFSEFSAKLKLRTFISDWSKSRVAGATMALGDTANAVFMFSQIFNDCASRRPQADLSVRRIGSGFFKEALQLATTNNEKANVLALQGVQPFQDGLTLLEKIYELNPKHPLLELVFAREINKNEMAFFAEKNSNVFANSENFYDENYKIDKRKIEEAEKKGERYLDKLLDFSERVASENKVVNSQFWNLSSAYFLYLKNESGKGLELLKTIKTDGNPFMKKQVDFLTFEMMEKKPSAETEQVLLSFIASYKDVKTFRDNNVLMKMSQTLAGYYANKKEEKKSSWFWSCSSDKNEGQGNNIKAFLALNVGVTPHDGYGYDLNANQNDLIDTCSVDFLEKVIAFTQNKELNINDKKLVQLSNLTTDYVNLALARRQVLESKFESAAATLKLIPAKTLTENGFGDYFESEAKDFNFGKSGKIASPIAYIQDLARLQAKISAPNATASDWYTYGKGLYNLSYYGQAWILTHRDKSSSEMLYDKDINHEYYLTNNAKKAFEKALTLNSDKELAAKICYAGALCERNQYWVKYYSNKPDDYNQEESYLKKMGQIELPKYRTFFTKLWKNYSDTQYQKMVLKECETYKDFIQ